MSAQLDRIESKLDFIIQRMNTSTTTPMPKKPVADVPDIVAQDVMHMLHNWTVKQHVCLQMLLRSASNEEIAGRMRVTTNTAKVHVRTLMKKLGVNSRSEIVAKCLVAFNEVSADTYMMMTGGLPKDWDASYSEPDPFEHLIFGEKG